MRNSYSFNYKKGKVIYIPELLHPGGEIKLGFESNWYMPKNADELESAVFWVSNKRLPLQVKAPEWVGVSHDKQENRDIIHLFNYNTDNQVAGIKLEYSGTVKNAWYVSPDEQGKKEIHFSVKNGITTMDIPNMEVYKVIVLEK